MKAGSSAPNSLLLLSAVTVAGALAQERNGSRRSGIHLNNINVVVLIDDELDIVQADNADGFA